MANEKNLIPVNKRTKNEAREISKKGGIASGEERRRRKKISESLEILLEMTDENGLTNQEKMVKALYDKSLKGDVWAFKEIRDTIGEKPDENVKGDITITIKGMKDK